MEAAQKRQPEIPGTERETIPDIEQAALALDAVRYKRMELQVDEQRLHAQLLERMEAHKDELEKDDNGVPIYTVIDGEWKKNFRLKSKTKVTCERKKLDGGD